MIPNVDNDSIITVLDANVVDNIMYPTTEIYLRDLKVQNW